MRWSVNLNANSRSSRLISTGPENRTAVPAAAVPQEPDISGTCEPISEAKSMRPCTCSSLDIKVIDGSSASQMTSAVAAHPGSDGHPEAHECL